MEVIKASEIGGKPNDLLNYYVEVYDSDGDWCDGGDAETLDEAKLKAKGFLQGWPGQEVYVVICERKPIIRINKD